MTSNMSREGVGYGLTPEELAAIDAMEFGDGGEGRSGGPDIVHGLAVDEHGVEYVSTRERLNGHCTETHRTYPGYRWLDAVRMLDFLRGDA